MAISKITEKTVAESIKEGAHVLITQPETVDGQSVETLERATLEDIKGVIAPFKVAYGRTSISASFVYTADYSSAGFTSKPYVVACRGTTGSSSQTSGGQLSVFNVTNTSAKITVAGLTTSSSVGVTWIAIGK